MTITLTWQTVITAGSVITATILLTQKIAGGVRWFDKQEKQTTDIETLRAKHDREMEEMRKAVSRELQGIFDEQTLLTYGILACLKGLKEQGCNGPVTEAVNKIEKYLNNKAHESEGGFLR